MESDEQVHYRNCHFCEAMCGVEVRTRGGEVLSVRGDQDDPFSRGYICPKATALKALHEDPDRLSRPMRREGESWRELGWTAALDAAAEGLRAVRKAHGRDAVAVYQGNPVVHCLGLMTYGQLLVRRVGTKHRYSATSVDQLPVMLAALEVLGNQVLMPVPDIDRTDYMVLLGANPVVSNGSIMTAPNAKGRLKAIQARGGTVVVIDPRRTETAALADAHHFVRPGSDALLLMAWLNVVFADDLVRLGHLGPHVAGVEALRAVVAEFTPEAVASATGIDAATLREIAHAHAQAERAVLYGRVGVSVHAFGGLCAWLTLAINTLTGHLDREGGSMFTTPAFDLVGLAERIGETGSFDSYRSAVRGLPEFGGELPVATLAEEIEAGNIRALVTMAGNPVLSTPNGARLEKALASLDFMVSIDPYMNETTRHANVLLAPSSPLARDRFDIGFNAFSVRNVAKYSGPVFPRGNDERDDWEIALGLWSRLEAPGRALPAVLRRLVGFGPRRWIDLGMRVGPHKLTVKQLEQNPHGLDLGPLEQTLVKRLRGRKVQLAPPRFLGDVPRLRALLAEAVPDLVLIGRRTLRSNNSWMNNCDVLSKGPERCTLLMHPDDADARGINGRAVIESDVGRIEAPVVRSDEVMPGVVCLPHGWGHHRPGTRMRVAAARAGVSINDVMDDRRVDALSGASALNGQPVTVTPA